MFHNQNIHKLYPTDTLFAINIVNCVMMLCLVTRERRKKPRQRLHLVDFTRRRPLVVARGVSHVEVELVTVRVYLEGHPRGDT
jgi:hypothetical protein